MDDTQRLHLQNMIAANNVEDNTDLIRKLKHSHILREDVNNLIMLKSKYNDDLDEYDYTVEKVDEDTRLSSSFFQYHISNICNVSVTLTNCIYYIYP